MNVLFVTANLPYPPNSGATIRTYNLLVRLARRHRVHLVAYANRAADAERLAIFERVCASVTPVDWRETKGTPRFYGQLAANLASPLPFAVARFTRPAMRRAIEQRLADTACDLLCCDFVTLALNLPAARPVPMHLTAHNVESVLWRRYLTHERHPLRAVYVALQYVKMRRFERRVLAGFQHVACMSAEDLERLRELSAFPQYAVVPNGVDLEQFRPDPAQEAPGRLVFTGALDWRPNQDALRYFLADVYPRIRQAMPSVTFHVVGREPPPGLRALAVRHPGVTVVGTVPDMRPHLASAAVYVVPLRVGGGTRLKILEAMAMARPVVSTPVGSEGLAVTPGRDLLVADDAEGFAGRVVELLRDRARAAALGAAGRRLVESIYGWDQIASTLDEEWRKAAGGAR